MACSYNPLAKLIIATLNNNAEKWEIWTKITVDDGNPAPFGKKKVGMFGIYQLAQDCHPQYVLNIMIYHV